MWGYQQSSTFSLGEVPYWGQVNPCQTLKEINDWITGVFIPFTSCSRSLGTLDQQIGYIYLEFWILNKAKSQREKIHSSGWWQSWESSCELVNVSPAAVVPAVVVVSVPKTWSWLWSYDPSCPWFKSKFWVWCCRFPVDDASYLISFNLTSFLFIWPGLCVCVDSQNQNHTKSGCWVR